MEQRKIVIILGSMGKGGAERVVSNISNYFVQKEWKVYIVLLLSGDVSYYLDDRIKIIDISDKSRSRVLMLPKWLCGIRTIVKDIKPDTILSFAARINVITSVACLGLNRKIVLSERNDPYMDGRGLVTNLGTKIFYPMANSIVFQTKRAKSYFLSYKLKDKSVIPNPISVSTLATKCKFGKIVSVGRLSKQKNQAMLIRAFAKIIDIYPYAKLTIYGEGELRASLQKMIDDRNLQDKIQLPGIVDNIHDEIKDANIFVLSSDYEGLSNALLEALVMGVPCISTRVAGSDEYIENGKNGLLIDVGDEDALANAMKVLLENDSLCEEMSRKARESADVLSMDTVCEEWFKVLSR